MKGSIRWRLFSFAAVTILVALVAAGGALVLIFENHLLRRVAQDLEIRWTELARSFALDAEGRPLVSREFADPRYLRPYGGAYWEIQENGKPALRSRSLWDFELSATAAPSAERTGAFEMEGPNQSELYVVERSVTHQSGSQERRFLLQVALDHAEIGQLREAFTYDVAKVLALLVVLLVAGGVLQLHFGLAPFERLRLRLGDMRDGRASRLDGDFPVEVAPLVDDLNGLLDRQDKLIERARARAGSLAHGLKTPMTILSGEIGRLEEDGQPEIAASLREQYEAIRLHVERELAKARTHGAIRSSIAKTDARRMVESLVDLMCKVDTEDRIRWDVAVPEGVTTPIEAGDFAEIVGNLLDNARKWARSVVRVEYGGGRLSVVDDGPGVEKGLRDHVLDRGVHAANAPGGSTGLGLSIVIDALAEYGLELSFDPVASGCRIGFPLDARDGRRAPSQNRHSSPRAEIASSASTQGAG